MSSPSTIFNTTWSEQSTRNPGSSPMPDPPGHQDISRVVAGESLADVRPARRPRAGIRMQRQ